VKAITDFNVSARFGHQFYCRECQKGWYRGHRTQHIANVNANSLRYRGRNRDFIREYLLGHPCVDCGETNPALLEFDHVRDKFKEVSKLVTWSVSLETLAAEIAKCEVRCVNCHLRRTAQQLGWRKAREAPVADVLEVWD
jgi:hypothetical protein